MNTFDEHQRACVAMSVTPCKECGGGGWLETVRCRKCRGRGFITEAKRAPSCPCRDREPTGDTCRNPQRDCPDYAERVHVSQQLGAEK